MPKIIKNLEKKILDSADRAFSQDGYEKVTIRAIAAECGMALGTFYNYFNSKEDLVGAVYYRNWLKVIERIEVNAEKSFDVMDGLKELFDEFSDFAKANEKLWTSYILSKDAFEKSRRRHSFLRAQLEKPISVILGNSKVKTEENIAGFLAEIIISLVGQNLEFSDYEQIIHKTVF